MNDVPNHVTRDYTGIVLERLRHLPSGGKMGDLPPHLQHDSFVRKGAKKTGGPNLRLLRLEDDIPSLTVTAYIFNKFVHPHEDRHITPREAACLQDFPDTWAFSGTLGQVHKQIGNAVPVNLAKAIAGSVANYLHHLGIAGDVPVASFFTGAGGLDLGFEKCTSKHIQFETRFTTDIEQWAGDTIRQNRPDWGFVGADVRRLNSEVVLRAIGSQPTVVIGGPPCQPFSVAGKRRATSDPLGALYRDYLRHIKYLKPEIVVMENVYGLAQVKSANMVEEIERSFEAIGYQTAYRELLAADYGTPQKRRRLFFVAAKDISHFRFPEPEYAAESGIFGLQTHRGAGNSFAHLPPPRLLVRR